MKKSLLATLSSLLKRHFLISWVEKIRKETTEEQRVMKGTLKKMRKPLKEREKKLDINQAPKNEYYI